MAPQHGQSQQPLSRQPSEVPNGLPTLNSHPHERNGPMMYQRPDYYTSPSTPATSGCPNPSPELAVSNPSTRAYCEQIQQAFGDIHNIIRHRIRPTLNEQHSDFWNGFWNSHHAQSSIASEKEKLELRDKVGDLNTENNAVKAESSQLRRKRTEYRKTVFRLASSVALQHERLQKAKLESVRLRARIVDLEVREAETSTQHAEELLTKQKAVDEAKDDFQTQINDLEQAILHTDKSFTKKIQLKQKAFDKRVEACRSLETKLQRESERTSEVKRHLELSKMAYSKLHKEIKEATLARDKAKKNEEAEKLLSMKRVIALQAEIDSCNAVIEYLKQRNTRFADSADKSKALARNLRSEIETIEAHSTSLTHQLVKTEEESESLRADRVKLQDRLKKSTQEIDELSNDVRKKGMENLQLQNENSRLLKANRRLQRKIDITRRGLDDEHSDDEDCQTKDAESASHSNDSAHLNSDTKASSTSTSKFKDTAPHAELTPPKTPHSILAPSMPAPTLSPMSPPLTTSHPPWLPALTSQSQPPQFATPSSPARSSGKLGEHFPAKSPEHPNTPKDYSHRVLSREELAEVGRMQKRPGTEIRAPTGPKSSVPRRRPGSLGMESPSKRWRSDCYRP